MNRLKRSVKKKIFSFLKLIQKNLNEKNIIEKKTKFFTKYMKYKFSEIVAKKLIINGNIGNLAKWYFTPCRY